MSLYRHSPRKQPIYCSVTIKESPTRQVSWLCVQSVSSGISEYTGHRKRKLKTRTARFNSRLTACDNWRKEADAKIAGRKFELCGTFYDGTEQASMKSVQSHLVISITDKRITTFELHLQEYFNTIQAHRELQVGLRFSTRYPRTWDYQPDSQFHHHTSNCRGKQTSRIRSFAAQPIISIFHTRT